MQYTQRILEDELERALRLSAAVNITGPRACGKTTTAARFAQSTLALHDLDDPLTVATRLRPEAALEGTAPRLLDEWQLVPELWSAVRREVDRDPTPGRFILSGSAWPENDALRHSGAGRILDLRMRTMSLFESGHSTGEVSLQRLRDGSQDAVGGSTIGLEDVVGAIVRGGWPAWQQLAADEASVLIAGYIAALTQREFELVAGTRRSPERFAQFLRAYATLTAHPTPLATVGARLAADGIDVGKNYPALLHDFAERLHIVEDQPAWSGPRRSKTRLVANPKRHFVDPSLATAMLGLDTAGLFADPETLGLLFESLVVRDLRIYAQASRATVLHYRTKDATAEIDAIVEWPNGDWIGVEVKLSVNGAEQAAARLLQVAAAIERPARALAVVVPTAFVAQLPNGVWVLPVNTIGP